MERTTKGLPMRKIFLIITISGIFVVILVILPIFNILTVKNNSNSPYLFLHIKTIITQDQNWNLHLNSLELKEGYPQEYKLNLPQYYYNFLILDGNKRSLDSGKFLFKTIIVAETFEEQPRQSESTVALENITLRLPYYKEGKQLLIIDGEGNEKLKVDLSHLSPPESYHNPNLCGNNMCDSNENILTCFNDCKRNIRFTWEEVYKYYLP